MDSTTPGSPSAKAAVVTGAGRGIGAAIARRLARDGYLVVAAARTEADVAAVARATPGVEPLVADVSRQADVDRMVAAATQLGPLGVWVNNAAVTRKTPFAVLGFAEWRAILGIDLDGVFLGCRAAFTAMQNAGGAIVNLASLSGVPNVEKFPGNTAYNVAKAGVIALTEAVALEGRQHRIRCFCISPGAVDTDMLRVAAPHLRAGMTPEDLAVIVSWLVSPDAVPLSGTNIPIFSNT